MPTAAGCTAASAPREAASWWLVQEDTFALIARSAIILALGKYPQAVTLLRAVEKMLVENYPIPRRAASRRGFGNFCAGSLGDRERALAANSRAVHEALTAR